MREHKYRAWDINNKKMYRVIALEMHDNLSDRVLIQEIAEEIQRLKTIKEKEKYLKLKKYTTVQFWGTDKNDSWIRIEENFELMEYTGLKDKRDKYIFEGDIVKNEYGYPLQIINSQDLDKEIYGERALGFMQLHLTGEVVGKFQAAAAIFPDDKFEIIGNVFENPELLKQL